MALLAGGLAVGLVAAAAWWAASRALIRSNQAFLAGSRIKFTVSALDANAVSQFEPIGSPAVFTDAKLFGNQLCVAGPSGLQVYDAQGKMTSRFAVGLQLPPAPLMAMAPGLAADAGEPELYVATAGEGLLAFNGRAFRQIRPEEPAFRRLTAVLPLSTGRVLLGTENKGVLVYDGKQISRFHPSLNDLHVSALAGDESALWVGTLDSGVLFWHAGQVDKLEGLPDPQVLALATQGTTAWVGTPAGVAEFRDGRFARVLAPGLFARALLPRPGKLAIGTQDEGVVELPLEATTGRATRPALEPLSSAVQSLFEIQGQLYALCTDALYSRREGALGWRPALAREAAVLTDHNVSALAADASGRLWVGYFDRGLDILDAGGGRATHVEDEHVFCVNRIVPDPQHGTTAVATANGLVLFDLAGKPRQVLGRGDGLIADHVTDVVFQQGNMVAATPAGLTFFGPAGPASLYAFHGLVNNHVYALAADGGQLLAGTLGGLSIIDRGAVRASYTTANSGLKHNWITAIARAGNEWFVGTYGAGILRLDAAGRWDTFAEARGFEVNPNAMLATANYVLAGTLGGGLYVFDRANGRWTALSAGLPSSNVTALAAAGGFLYIGTDNGLVRIEARKIGSGK